MRPPVTQIKHTHVSDRPHYSCKGVFDVRLWWSPGGVLRETTVDVATFYNPKQQWCQHSETVAHLPYVQKHMYTNGSNSIPAVVYFLISLPYLSLTDDDVLEDVRVVVRCCCHYGTVMINSIRVQNYLYIFFVLTSTPCLNPNPHNSDTLWRKALKKIFNLMNKKQKPTSLTSISALHAA